MFGSAIIDVAIGVVFIYLLLSLVCSAVREALESMLKTRSAQLQQGLRELLNDPSGKTLVKAIYNHPLIDCLFRGTYEDNTKDGIARLASKLPTYIPAANFARALIDIAARGDNPNDANAATATNPVTPAVLRATVAHLNNPPVQRALLTALDSATDLASVQQYLEQWFDSAMDRVSGWYKRQTQAILFVLGLLITIGVNANTITLADYLYSNKTARDALVAAAQGAKPDTATATVRDAATRIQDLAQWGLPIGWTWEHGRPRPKGIHAGTDTPPFVVFLWALAGWLLTAFALSLGAPFWFDTLNKFMQARSTTKPEAPAAPAAKDASPAPAVSIALSAPSDGAYEPRVWASGDPQAGAL